MSKKIKTKKKEDKLTKHKKPFLMNLLKKMILIRRFEEKAGMMYGIKKIGGFCHLYIGQEAVAVGSIAACNLNKDYIITTYRDHGHALMCDINPNAVMAELFGKVTGTSKGKGGSMHLFDVEKHFYGGHAIVGGHFPIATGMAYKIKYKKQDGVVLCYFGDGAIHMGTFHESVNMAKIWNLPIIFICENNKYGMGTDYKRISSLNTFYKIAENYNMIGQHINGMDVLEVYNKTNDLIKEARNGNPSICEIETYRYKGHSMSDPAKYRTREELDKYKSIDPINTLKNDLIKVNMIDENEYKLIDKNIKQQVEESIKYANESSEPEISSIYEDILK